MKKNILLILFVSTALISSCKNEEIKPQRTSISKIKSDSTSSTGNGGHVSSTNSGGGVMSSPGRSPVVPLSSQELIAKWNLVRDSVYDSMGNYAAPRTIAYNGAPGDYFDFRADGKCYTKEGNTYDTLTYQVTATNQVIIQKFGLNINGSYEPDNTIRITDTTAEILTQFLPTPDGFYMRYLYLKK